MKINRREAIKKSSLATLGFSLSQPFSKTGKLVKSTTDHEVNHSVCRWCYNDIPLEAFADQCKDIGVHSIELLDAEEWDIVLSRGLKCALSNGSKLGITKGFNATEHHAQLLKEYSDLIPKATEYGIPQIICFSGNRNGMKDELGLENCAVGLDPIVKMAEKYGLTITMELLNSKIDHKDYQCDHTEWGVQLVDKIGSPNFKLLYDIYHMQIMEGDVIRTIQTYSEYISHYHTGGVPGRNEIDASQELYYPAIVKAIVDTGFQGYIAQEFIPTRDPIKSLKQGIIICDI